ncbi:MAG: hypothetical protein WAT39_18875 [Planctomycetota bacterium]
MAEAGGSGVVVGRDGGARDLATVRAAATALANELPPPVPDSHVAFCFEHDHAAFLVALLATWTRGHVVALPCDARRHAVGLTLALPSVVKFLHDTGAGTGICVSDRPWLPANAVLAANPGDWAFLGSLTLCVPDGARALRQIPVPRALLDEQLDQDARTTAMPCSATLVTTYDPGHLRALVPGLLGPLRRGLRVVGAAGCVGPALASLVGEHAATDLLASPDRLRGLAALPRGTFPALRRVHTLDDLEPTATARLRTEHGVTVHVLKRVTLDEPGRELRHALLAQAGVADVELARLEPPAEPVGRWLVAVAAGPDLVPALDSVAATVCAGEPAPIVYAVDHIPRDHNGGAPTDWVRHTSGRRRDGTAPSRELHWQHEDRGERSWRAKATLPATYAGFDGHFEGHPVLSGSSQLHDVVLPALQRALPARPRVREFTDLKFLARISPGDTIDVALDFAADGGSATFVLARGEVKCTTGRAVWQGGA